MIKNISIIFFSIFFESIPFLLLGAFISSLIECYIFNDGHLTASFALR